MIFSSCNKKVNKDDPEMHNGEWIWWHEKGKENGEWIKAKPESANEFTTGYYSYWHTNGLLESEGHLINGKKNGPWKTWYKDGHLRDSTTYKNDLLHGKQVMYHQDINYFTLYKEKCPYDSLSYYFKYIAYYDMGKKIDSTTNYFEDNSTQSITHYKNGQKDGKEIIFYREGKIFGIKEYKNGVEHGPKKRWSREGILLYSEQLNSGLTNGLVQAYYPNGKKYFSEYYIKGKRDGISEIYYENGGLQRKGLFKTDVAIGEWIFYKPNGEIEKILTY